MADYVTVAGLQLPTLEERIADVSARQREIIHPSLQGERSDTVEGQLNGIVLSALRETDEALQVAYNGFDRDASTGKQLDDIGELTGSARKPASKTLIRTVTVNLDAGKSFLAGELQAHVEDVPDRTASNKYPVASTTAGNYTVDFEADDAGPLAFPSGKLNTIAAAVTGWNSVTNPTDGVLGEDAELDTPYRARQRQEVQSPGQGPLGSVVALVSKIVGVESVTSYENVKSVRDPATGLPPNTFEIVIGVDATRPPTDQEVAEAIFSKAAGGNRSFGLSSYDVTDAQGDLQTVRFSKAQDVAAKLSVTIQITKLSEYGSDGTDLLKQALAAKAISVQKPGKAMVVNVYRSAAQQQPGVYDVLDVKVGFSAATSSSNLPVSVRQRITLDTSDITVVVA